MNTTAVGLQGEQVATDYLIAIGYEILVRNWRTKVCEIDIISRKDGKIHFVEVKYRSRAAQGSGLEYITPQKIKRLWFAAQVFTRQSGWRGDINIAGIEVNGHQQVTGFVPEIMYDL